MQMQQIINDLGTITIIFCIVAVLATRALVVTIKDAASKIIIAIRERKNQ